MDVVRLDRLVEREHPALLRQPIAFARVAGGTGSHHVGPVVLTTTGQRYQMIPRQALAEPELIRPSTAILAFVVVTGEQEGVGNLASELSWHEHVLDESDHGGFRKSERFAPNHPRTITLHDLGLAIEHETKRPAYRHKCERFKRGIQRKTAHSESRILSVHLT